jgi:glycosyltransferase involved in cell wall biosynthesis
MKSDHPVPPLLTICVATYNRASFLRVMLQALLPQAAAAGDEVEVWVIDNHSPDETAAVLVEAAQWGPFRTHRQPHNIGPVPNIIYGPKNLANGEYSWFLGDHNLLMPGALGRVVEVLRARRNLDAIYVNFRCATYPEQWPASALGGHDGSFAYTANPPEGSGPVARWSDLIRGGTSAICTQAYAHIVRTSIWRDFWNGRDLRESHTNGLNTYPHTWMLASTVFDRPSWQISEPVLTIFNGAQSWGDHPTRLKVYTTALPHLLLHYRRSGMSRGQIAVARDFVRRPMRKEIKAAFATTPPQRHHRLLLHTILTLGLRNRWLWFQVWSAYLEAETCPVARAVQAFKRKSRRTKLYCLRDCRPARWLRNHRRDSDRRHAG